MEVVNNAHYCKELVENDNSTTIINSHATDERNPFQKGVITYDGSNWNFIGIPKSDVIALNSFTIRTGSLWGVTLSVMCQKVIQMVRLQIKQHL